MPPARPPEQIMRDWLERNGSTRVGPDALAQTWGLDRLEASDRRRIAAALDGAGVDIDPPLQRASHSEKVTLSVRAVEPDPTPEPDPEPEREPALRPSAPTPPPQPRTTPGRPGVRRRAGRKARALLDRKPPPALPERPAPAPSSAAREEALRRDTAREQARAERERERERLRVEAAERVELKRREREEAEAATRDERERVLAEEEERAQAERERDRQTAEAEYRRERERARAEVAAPEPEPNSEADPNPEPSDAPVSRTTIGVIVAAVVLMILGALGPWAKAVFVVDYGVDRHGVFVIAAALITAVLLAIHLRRRRESWLPLIAAGAAAFSAALVAGDFRDLVDDPLVGPTWGIYAAFLGSVVAVVVSMGLLVRRR